MGMRGRRSHQFISTLIQCSPPLLCPSPLLFTPSFFPSFSFFSFSPFPLSLLSPPSFSPSSLSPPCLFSSSPPYLLSLPSSSFTFSSSSFSSHSLFLFLSLCYSILQRMSPSGTFPNRKKACFSNAGPQQLQMINTTYAYDDMKTQEKIILGAEVGFQCQHRASILLEGKGKA